MVSFKIHKICVIVNNYQYGNVKDKSNVNNQRLGKPDKNTIIEEHGEMPDQFGKTFRRDVKNNIRMKSVMQACTEKRPISGDAERFFTVLNCFFKFWSIVKVNSTL